MLTAGNLDPLACRPIVEAIVEQSDDGVMIADAAGHVLYHNATLRVLFALKAEVELRDLAQLGKFPWNRRGSKLCAEGQDGLQTDSMVRFDERILIGAVPRYLTFTVRRMALAGGRRNALRVIVVRDVTERRQLEATLEESKACGLITANASMLHLIERAKQVARSDAAVLLQGESGVGKSCFARLMHQHGARARQGLVELNCGAVPEALLEAEFFGQGTRADPAHRLGKLAAAHRATLFLDGIDAIPAHLQSKLVSALEDAQYRHPATGEAVRFDLRLISASSADLRRAVDGGGFRPELYYRIAVIPLRIPPLRERIGDIPVLVRHFCDNFIAKGLAPGIQIGRDAWQALLNYPWPGNIRELANAVEHGFICAEQGEITVDSLPQDIRLFTREMPPVSIPAVDATVEAAAPAEGGAVPQDEVLAALRKAHGSRAVAAKLLGIDRTTLWRRMRRMRLS